MEAVELQEQAAISQKQADNSILTMPFLLEYVV